MKKLLYLIFILTLSPVFAACPIDGITDACIAEFQTAPLAEPMKLSLPQNSTVKEFSSIPSKTDNIEREIDANTNLRKFGPQSQNYGYNSSCQFGVCRTTGTPTTFAANDNN